MTTPAIRNKETQTHMKYEEYLSAHPTLKGAPEKRFKSNKKGGKKIDMWVAERKHGELERVNSIETEQARIAIVAVTNKLDELKDKKKVDMRKTSVAFSDLKDSKGLKGIRTTKPMAISRAKGSSVWNKNTA